MSGSGNMLDLAPFVPRPDWIEIRRAEVLGPGMRASDIDGWDPFKQIEIILVVEERCGTKLDTTEIDGFGRIVLAKAKPPR